MKKSTDVALNFLCARNPLTDYLSQERYAFALMDYMEKKGEEALQALAGFYVWCLSNKKGKEFEYAVRGTFSHDLGGMNEPTMLPRSTDYLEFWEEFMKENHHPNLLKD